MSQPQGRVITTEAWRKRHARHGKAKLEIVYAGRFKRLTCPCGAVHMDVNRNPRVRNG
jgi:hypothetical protein